MLERSLFASFITRFEALGLPYMVTGSTAGIVYGEPRMTHDIDLVIDLTLRHVAAFVAQFPLEEFYCPPEDVLAIEVQRGQRGHCNLISHASGFKADVYIAFDELHRWGLARRRSIDVDGMTMSVAPPEYVIIRKLEYYQEGKSEKHLRDIRGILAMSEALIDREVLETKVGEHRLSDVWRLVSSE